MTAVSSSGETGVRPLPRPGAGEDRLAIALALLGVYVIWGSTYLAIRFAVQTIPPFLQAGMRFILAGIILYVVLHARGAPHPSREQWVGAAIVGALLLLGGNALVSLAERSVASHLAALLVATVPIWAALFARLWGHTPSRLEAAGLLLGFVGVGILNVGSSLHGNVFGMVILLVAASSWALGSVWSPHLSLPTGMMASATEQLCGGAMILVIGLARGERVVVMPSARSLWALLYLVVMGSIVAFTCYSFLLQRVRPALATSYAYVNPIVAVILGAGLAGESVTGSTLVALVVILAAVALVVLGRTRD
ncbi:MAG TPA: drug/metabolite exporter YedA [Chloroflexota bacterium]